MRPEFVHRLVELYGEPRVKCDEEQPMQTERGRIYRRCWVWFLPVNGRLSNHNIHIDRNLNGRWELGVGCHCSCKQLTSESKTEPTDAEAQQLLDLACWPAPTMAEVKS